MMEYKGYIGIVNYDSDAKIFHGDVINTKDVITSVQIASDIRRAEPIGLKGDYHPMLKSIKV